MDIVQLDIRLIDEDIEQPRFQFDETALQELMNSIAELGLLSPIKVRPIDGGRYKIIYGNRRYKAAMRLGKATIPSIISEAIGDLDIYLEQIAENLTREGFSPIEEAEAFHKLMNDSKFRSSIKFLSSKLGKPESYIKNKCELLKFSSAVKKLIVSGTEIRKNALTEEQLLPLKDLPVEHRNPLALIAARDELPVSDVKKIAKLFKDSSISDNIKEKLLLKDGSGLIETWSTRELNKKERARAAAEAAKKAEMELEKQQQEASVAESQTKAIAATRSEVEVGAQDRVEVQAGVKAQAEGEIEKFVEDGVSTNSVMNTASYSASSIAIDSNNASAAAVTQLNTVSSGVFPALIEHLLETTKPLPYTDFALKQMIDDYRNSNVGSDKQLNERIEKAIQQMKQQLERWTALKTYWNE